MGMMITRFRIEDEVGRVLTEYGQFSYEGDDAMEFRTEQDAIEECTWLVGATVERFQRYAEFPDYSGHNSTARLEQVYGRGA